MIPFLRLDDLAALTVSERREVFARLTGNEQDLLAGWLAEEQRAPADWLTVARPEQLPPAWAWFVWLILAGRGFGKTRTGAEWSVEKARTYPGCRIALVAATFADGRDTMVEGESGMLAVLDERELRGGNVDTAWNRSMGELFLANGTRAKVYSSEKPRQLRGPQHHFAWGDEAAQWNDADLGTAKDTTWSNLTIGCRLTAAKGQVWRSEPQVVVTTTPLPVELINGSREKVEGTRTPVRPGLMQQDTTALTRGKTTDNLANLADSYKRVVVDPLLGTRLGRQELDAEILEDVEGAIWTSDEIARDRWLAEPPVYLLTVVSIDPSASATGDLCGVVAVSKDAAGHLYVRHDRSLKAGPEERHEAACLLAYETGAGRLVYEGNQGGDMVASNLRSSWQHLSERDRVDGPCPQIVSVSARGSKIDRALTAKQVYEQRRVHHVGTLPEIVDELTTWTIDSNWSPGRLDALVHGVRHLAGMSATRGAVASQRGRILDGPPVHGARRPEPVRFGSADPVRAFLRQRW